MRQNKMKRTCGLVVAISSTYNNNMRGERKDVACRFSFVVVVYTKGNTKACPVPVRLIVTSLLAIIRERPYYYRTVQTVRTYGTVD
jgi:hypothetical protein